MVKLRRTGPEKQKIGDKRSAFSKMSRILTEGLVIVSAVGLLNTNTSHAQNQTKPTSTPATQSQVMLESVVVIIPDNEKGTVLNISVVVFEPTVDTANPTMREVMEQIVKGCEGEKDVQACISEKTLELVSSKDRKPKFVPFKGAHVIVEYYNPLSGQYMILPGCEDVAMDRKETVSGAAGSGEVFTYFYGQCDVSAVLGDRKRTAIRVTFIPQPGENIGSSSAMHTVEGTR